MKDGGSLGFSIIGGTDHSCVPFGGGKPGIFISHVSIMSHRLQIHNYNFKKKHPKNSYFTCTL